MTLTEKHISFDNFKVINSTKPPNFKGADVRRFPPWKLTQAEQLIVIHNLN